MQGREPDDKDVSKHKSPYSADHPPLPLTAQHKARLERNVEQSREFAGPAEPYAEPITYKKENTTRAWRDINDAIGAANDVRTFRNEDGKRVGYTRPIVYGKHDVPTTMSAQQKTDSPFWDWSPIPPSGGALVGDGPGSGGSAAAPPGRGQRDFDDAFARNSGRGSSADGRARAGGAQAVKRRTVLLDSESVPPALLSGPAEDGVDGRVPDSDSAKSDAGSDAYPESGSNDSEAEEDARADNFLAAARTWQKGALEVLDGDTKEELLSGARRYGYSPEYRAEADARTEKDWVLAAGRSGEPGSVEDRLDEAGLRRLIRMSTAKEGQGGDRDAKEPEAAVVAYHEALEIGEWHKLIREHITRPAKAPPGISLDDYKQFQMCFKRALDLVRDEENKDNARHEFWRNVGKWSEKHVSYKRHEMDIYRLTEDDKRNWSRILSNGPYKHRKMQAHGMPALEVDFHSLYHYEESVFAGQRLLRAVFKQHLVEENPPAVASSDRPSKIECHIMRFYQFDEEKQEFERQFESLYDVIPGTTDNASGSFTNDFFVAHNYRTYYFRKEVDEEKSGFQLYRHSMRDPPSLKASAKVYPAFGEIKMTDYFLDVGALLASPKGAVFKDLTIDDLGVVFLYPASKEYGLHASQQLEEAEFLDSKYICLYSKALDGKRVSKMQIFALHYERVTAAERGGGADDNMPQKKSCCSWGKRGQAKTPLVVLDAVQQFQMGFLHGEVPQDGSRPQEGAKVTFTIRGRAETYAIDYEFKEDSAPTEGEEEQRAADEGEEDAGKDMAKPTSTRARQCLKSRTHMYKIFHREVMMPYTAQRLPMIYFRSSVPGDTVVISPQRPTAPEALGPGVSNQQDEMYQALEQLTGSTNAPIIYEDYDYLCQANQAIRTYLQFQQQEDELLRELGELPEYYNYFASKDMIIQVNANYHSFSFWHVTPDHERADFARTLKQLEEADETTRNRRLQKQIFEQFDRRNQSIYQDNFLREWAQTVEPNQYARPLYMHRTKRHIISSHNRITVGSKSMEVDEDFLLLDLGAKESGWAGEAAEGEMSVIRLFSPDLRETAGLKLVKYWVSRKADKGKGLAVFFFLQRNTLKQSSKEDPNERQSGAYFFVVAELEALARLDEKRQDPAFSLLNEGTGKGGQGGTPITVIKSVDCFPQMNYTWQRVVGEQNNTVHRSFTNVEIKFDLVHDSAQTRVDFIVPFFFASERSQDDRCGPMSELRFATYLSFLDLTKFPKESTLRTTKSDWTGTDTKTQTTKGQQHYMKFYKVQQYKYIHENETTRPSLVWQEANQRRNCCQQLTRTSNWQKNFCKRKVVTEHTRTEIRQTTYTAKFQFGLYSDYQQSDFLEIQEILVTVDLNEPDVNDRITVDYLSLRHCFPSKGLKYRTTELFAHPMNHYLVPKIDDDGLISGSYLLLNLRQYKVPSVRLKTFEEGYFEAIERHMHDETLQWQPKYYTRAGSWAHVVRVNDGETCDLLFQDGAVVTFGCSAIKDLCPEEICLHTDHTDVYQYIQSGAARKSQFEYGIIELQDDDDTQRKPDAHGTGRCAGGMRLETPFVQHAFTRWVLGNRLGEYYAVTSSCFHRKVVEESVFGKNGQLTELYKAQTQNLCMSQINFCEVYTTGGLGREEHRLKAFFQPRLILKGKSACSIEFKDAKRRIMPLRTSLYKTDVDLNVTVWNSPLAIITEPLHPSEQPQAAKYTERLFLMLGMNRYQNFQYDLNQTSLIEYGLEEGYTKPVFEIVQFVLKVLCDATYQDMLISNLPELLSQQRIKFTEFLSRTTAEEATQDADDENRVESCNFESLLTDAELPFVSPPPARFFERGDFENFFDCRADIERQIKAYDLRDLKADILRNRLNNQGEQPQMGLSTAPEAQKADDIAKKPGDLWQKFHSTLDRAAAEKKVEVEYSIFNFQPMVRKIKIGLYLGLDSKNKEGNDRPFIARIRGKDPQYAHPANFNAIHHMDLAVLLAKQENNDFYECGSVNKLIDRQYTATRPLFQTLLLTYLGGFVLPAVTAACLFDKQRDEWNDLWRFRLSMVALSFNVLLWLLEFVEIGYHGWSRETFFDKYLKGYNFTDFLEPFVYGAHVALWFGPDHRAHPEMEIVYALVTFLFFLAAVQRILQYVRYQDDFAFSVSMLGDVAQGLVPFLCLFFLMVLFFALVQQLMSASVPDCSFPDFPLFLMILVQTLRNSVGDLDVPVMAPRWAPEDQDPADATFTQHVAVAITWGAWLLNIILMLVILLNFLITDVGQTYDKIKSKGKSFIYRLRSDVNLQAFVYLAFFSERMKRFRRQEWQKQFTVLVFKAPKNQQDSGEDEFFGMTNTIKKDFAILLRSQKAQLIAFYRKQQAALDSIRKQYSVTVGNQIESVKRAMSKCQDNTTTLIGDKVAGLKEKVEVVKTEVKTMEETGLTRASGQIDDIKGLKQQIEDQMKKSQ